MSSLHRVMHSGPALPSNPAFVRFTAAVAAVLPSSAEFHRAMHEQQGTPAWLADRKLRFQFDSWPVELGKLSGSTVSCAINSNPFTSRKKFVNECVFGRCSDGDDTNPAFAWGHGAEPWAARAFLLWCREQIGSVFHDADASADSRRIIVDVALEHYGMVLDRKHSMFGYSPDGVLVWTLRNPKDGAVTVEKELIEIKCRFKNRDLRDFTTDPIFPYEPIKHSQHVGAVPTCYFAQMQFGMWLMQRAGIVTRPKCHFIAWFPAHDRDPENTSKDPHVVLELDPHDFTASTGDSPHAPPPPLQQPVTKKRKRAAKTTYGPDECTLRTIHVQTFPHGAFAYTMVPQEEAFTSVLLEECNKIWEEDILPMAWYKLFRDQSICAAAASASASAPVFPFFTTSSCSSSFSSSPANRGFEDLIAGGPVISGKIP